MSLVKLQSLEKRRKKEGLIFLAPWLIGFAAFFIFPLGYSLVLSFCKVKNFRTMELVFVGVDHFKRAFLEDTGLIPKVLEVIGQTVTMGPLIVIFSFFVAVLLNKNIRFRGFFRAAFFLPVIIGTGFIMEQLSAQGVQLNTMNEARKLLLPDSLVLYIGAEGVKMVDSFLGMLSSVFWKSGVQIIIFLAALQKIPSSLYESALVDSATEWEMFWLITLPQISPMILLCSVYTCVDFFTSSDNPAIALMRSYIFNSKNFEYGAAVSWIYCLLVLVLVGWIFLLMLPMLRRSADEGRRKS